MTTALPDTNAVSDLMRNDPKVTAKVAGHPGPIVTSVIVEGEIRYGLERLPAGKKRTDLEARAVTILAALSREPITPPVSERYGRLKSTLEASGLNLQDNDIWIAAGALALGGTLVTRDHIFAHIPGLVVEDWTA